MDTLELNAEGAYLSEGSTSPVVMLLNDGLLNLPLDTLQIKGRLTPISALSNVSTRESSLNSSPQRTSRRSSYYGPDELEYDNVGPSDSPVDSKELRSQLAVDDAEPGFNWSPLPLRKHASDKSEQDTTESEVSVAVN